jgi:hypothetical protein
MKKYLSFVVAAASFFFTSTAQCTINPVTAISADTMYFYNERGELLFRYDDALKTASYVIKTRKQFHEIFHEIPFDDTTTTSTSYNPATVLSISRRISRKVEKLIRRGDIHNPLVTENIVEVLDKSVLRRMYDNIQSRCNNNDAKNFREHGGVLLPDGTITCITGDLSDPRLFAGATLYVEQEALVYYHSHPSGCVEQNGNASYAAVEDRNPNKVLFSGSNVTRLICYIQGPSKQDQDAVGNKTGYVFGMDATSGLIYIYDREGVKATLPVSFVKKVRKSESQKPGKIETDIAGAIPAIRLPYFF